eukprot:363794-Chlamydomonas_euryale.AAC.1
MRLSWPARAPHGLHANTAPRLHEPRSARVACMWPRRHGRRCLLDRRRCHARRRRCQVYIATAAADAATLVAATATRDARAASHRRTFVKMAMSFRRGTSSSGSSRAGCCSITSRFGCT